MSTTIAIANQKSGVGKTCTTLNLGIGLALKGKEVLLIDLDPQANLTMSLGWTNPDEQATTISTLLHKTANEQAIEPGEGILRHPEGVDLIPSSIQLSGYEANLLGEFGRESVLRQYIDGVRPLYDYILIDCMPSLNILTIKRAGGGGLGAHPHTAAVLLHRRAANAVPDHPPGAAQAQPGAAHRGRARHHDG